MGIFDFLNRIPTKSELKGGYGEWLAKHFSKAFTDAYVLHDVLIEGADGFTSQIDLILIGQTGLYVVEVKMFDEAKVYGDGNKSKWYYYKYKKKYEIYSPIKQNKKHIEYLKNFLKDFGDVPCFSVITLICEDFKVSNVNPEGVKDTVVCSTLPAMKEGIELLSKDKPIVFDEAKKKELFDFISANQISGKKARAEHKQNVKEYKQNLEEMKENKICPYCKTPLFLRKGKYGEFYGCPNYPKCRYTLKKQG